jgi:hypothetical protein
MSLGVSLPCDYLSGAGGSAAAAALQEALGTADGALAVLADAGVASVEVRHVFNDTPSGFVIAAVQRVWRAGLRVSLHPSTPPRGEVAGLAVVFPWLPAIVGDRPRGQQELLLTIHACSAVGGDLDRLRLQTEVMFGRLSQMADQEGMPLRFALELNRAKEPGDPSTTYRDVGRMHAAIAAARVGICWDWGHTHANVSAGLIPRMPPPEFVREVIHTHIHDLGPTGATHWPLGSDGVPLAEYAGALRRSGYRGVYCLELSPERFHPQPPVDRALMASIDLLAAATAGGEANE